MRDRRHTHMDGFTIRPGRADDLPAIECLEGVSYCDPWPYTVLRRSLDGPFSSSLVALSSDGTVVGYAFFRVVADELEVHSLAVAPSWRRRGVATRLLEMMERAGRRAGVSRMLLEVRKSNDPALRLYHAQGFTVDTVRRRYYADGEDAVLMSRAVESAPESEESS